MVEKAILKYSGSATLGVSLPSLFSVCAKEDPPILKFCLERSMNNIIESVTSLITGSTIFLISDTSPTAEIITVPGANTTELSGYFWVMERESFPVGILSPKAMEKSDAAFTASYNLASSPGFLHGHIQLALNEIPLIPPSIGAQMTLVRLSAMEIIEPFFESIIAGIGACPKAVATPFSPL